ncbi:MAG: hypothetical protein CMF61_07890 [Magnetococcales bacterium]|nr:hypothetical protein [Magnetococcales bacterium]
MLTLPVTPEQYTQFALEYSGYSHSFYSGVLNGSFDYNKFAVRTWVRMTAYHCPELCRVEHVKSEREGADPDSVLTDLYIAGVRILSSSGRPRTVQDYAGGVSKYA